MRALAALALSLMTACVSPPELRPRAPTPGVPHVQIASFNVDLKRFDDAPTVEAVGRTGAAIVVLQEVSAGWREALEARYASDYPHRAYEGEASGGLAILSKHPFADGGVIPGVDGWHPAWRVVVDAPTGPLQVLAVHLKPPYSKREGISGYFDADAAHVREIRTFLDACAPDLPTIVLGDFNESVDGAAIEFLEDRGFRNVLPQFRPGQETWRYARATYDQTIDTLDHILYTARELDPLNAYVRYDGNSDHLPVVALFERRSQPVR